MRTYERSTAGLTADPDGIAAAQQTAGAADLSLNGAAVSGGVADFSAAPRRVSLNSAGNIATVVFTIYGTDRMGSPITDTVTGISNSTVTSNKVFATVTRIAASAAVGSDVIAGYGAESISAWLFLGAQRGHCEWGYELDVTGTVNVDIEQTFRNILREKITGEYHTGITDFKSAKTADEAGAITPVPVAIRLVQNSGSGSAVLRVVPTRSS